jgi:hypothetical protein
MIAAELTRVFQVVGIGKTQKARDIFVDIDALDEVLSISVPVNNEEMVVYAATFKTFLRARPDQVKGQWNKVISKIREEQDAMKAEQRCDEVESNE